MCAAGNSRPTTAADWTARFSPAHDTFPDMNRQRLMCGRASILEQTRHLRPRTTRRPIFGGVLSKMLSVEVREKRAGMKWYEASSVRRLGGSYNAQPPPLTPFHLFRGFYGTRWHVDRVTRDGLLVRDQKIFANGDRPTRSTAQTARQPDTQPRRAARRCRVLCAGSLVNGISLPSITNLWKLLLTALTPSRRCIQ